MFQGQYQWQSTVEPLDSSTMLGFGPGAHPSTLADTDIEGTRIVVFTDVDFAANEYIKNPGNQDIIRNSVNWLAKKETHLGISGKTPEFRTASFSHSHRLKLFFGYRLELYH